MSKGLTTILLLTFSNIFMTLAWYGHLKFAQLKSFQNLGLFTLVVFKTEQFKLNHLYGAGFPLVSIYFFFKK